MGPARSISPARSARPVQSVDRGQQSRRTAGLLALIVALAVACLVSASVGARDLSLGQTWQALVDRGSGQASLVLWESRIPRTLTGLVVGPALGACGALIQAYTRNPLADPGILGVNAGAVLGVTLGIGVLGISAAAGYVWFAFVGALVATLVVYVLGSRGGGASPERVTLAGVALGAVLSGIATGIALRDRNVFTATRFWGVGSLASSDISQTWTLVPFVVLGLVLALLLSRSLNALALGDDLGRSLGARVGTVRVLTVVAVTLLAGGATAIAGPIAFVGLMVPHAVRWVTGPDQRWIIPTSMVAGAVLLLVSDVLARVVLPSGEVRVGLVTAVVGAPVLIALVRRRQLSAL
ncbi:FecCD family ABC transporter permease [Quadrisphaera granulorum]|uniref:FecCD family ABC transporter permease n=1 Tax=Quadrisphaera granulorum TaxID=317664 RepID=UPI003CCC8C59